MDYRGEKDRLCRLRDSYIKELKNLKLQYTKGKKNVRFNLKIETINDLSQCACDLECILKVTEWKCTRRKGSN